jgi:hypothetical protein
LAIQHTRVARRYSHVLSRRTFDLVAIYRKACMIEMVRADMKISIATKLLTKRIIQLQSADSHTQSEDDFS